MKGYNQCNSFRQLIVALWLVGVFICGMNACLAQAAPAFQVNITNRAEVRAFFNAVYRASDEVPINTSAKVTNCIPGTNSQAFKNAIFWRINWFRAMVGVPANVSLNDSYSSNAQKAALMMSAQGAWSHTPTNGWPCWTTGGSNAAYNANLAINTYGADAITTYIDDFGAENVSVGHRRYMLYPQTLMMGTGDMPGQNGHVTANATWVIDDNYGGVRPQTRKPEVAWPPAGFVSYPAVFRRWSFSYPAASFSGATVGMLSNGVPISAAKEAVINGYGENTLVWIPAGLNANTSGYRWPRPATDTVYTVFLTNVTVRGNPSNFTYTVTVFDPDIEGPDETLSTLTGPSNPLVGQQSGYFIRALPYAEQYEWRVSHRSTWTFQDGAENGLTNFTAATSPGYSTILAGAGFAGSRAFHLAHPQPLVSESLKLNGFLTPGTNGGLIFKSKLGYAGSGENARVQASTDDGNSWRDLYVQSGSGGAGESAFTTKTIFLTNFINRSIQLRFLYDFIGGNYFSVTNSTGGWFIDDVVITNCTFMTSFTGGLADGTNFTFNPVAGTNFFMEARGIMFGQFPVSWGPGLNLTSSVPPQITSTTRQAASLSIEFLPGSYGPTNLCLYRAITFQGPWSMDGTAVLKTNTSNGHLQFTTPIGADQESYFRVRER